MLIPALEPVLQVVGGGGGVGGGSPAWEDGGAVRRCLRAHDV